MKKERRNLSAAIRLLAATVILLFAGGSRQVLADQHIATEGVRLIAPIVGNKADYDEDHYSFVGKLASEHVTIRNVNWFYKSGDYYKEFGSKKFAIDGEYAVQLQLKADEGYYFTDDTVYFQPLIRSTSSPKICDTSDLSISLKPKSKGREVELFYKIKPSYGLRELSFNLPTPSVGSTPRQVALEQGITFKSDVSKVFDEGTVNEFQTKEYYLSKFTNYWYKSEDGTTYEQMGWNETFKAGCWYISYGSKYAAAGLLEEFYKAGTAQGLKDRYYGISDSLQVTVNPDYASFVNFSGTDPEKWGMETRLEFGAKSDEIKDVGVFSLNYPWPGSTPDTTAYPTAGGMVRTVYVNWNTSAQFVGGQEYTVQIREIAASGYKFKQGTADIMINGEKMKTIDIGYDQSEVTYSVKFTCPSSFGPYGVRGVNHPKVGEHPDMDYSKWLPLSGDGELYKPSHVVWGKVNYQEDADTGEVEETYTKLSGSNWTFESGNTYYAEITLFMQNGNKFPSSRLQRESLKAEVVGADRSDFGWAQSDYTSQMTIRAIFTPYEVIDHINIYGYKSPVEGKKAAYEGYSTKSDVYVVDTNAAENTEYQKGGVTWGLYKGGGFVPFQYQLDGLTFEKNQAYCVQLLLRTVPGYTFASELSKDDVTVGKASANDLGAAFFVERISDEAVYVRISKYVYPLITTIYYELDEPVAGALPGKLTVTSFPAHALNKKLWEFDSTAWWQVSDDGIHYEHMPSGTAFEDGKYYRTSVHSGHLLNMLLYDLAGILTRETLACGLSNDCVYYMNRKDLDLEGTLDAEGYFVFDNLAPKKEDPPSPGPEPGKETPGGVTGEVPVLPDLKGTEVEALEKVILSSDSEEDIAGSEYAKLCAKASKTTKNAITLKWNKVNGAAGYLIYGAKCGTNTYVKLKELAASKKTFTQKKLKKGTYYKYIVVAYDKDQKVLTSSRIIHAATAGGKVGNAKSIKVKNVKKNKKSLKAGKRFKLKFSQTAESKKQKIKTHRKPSFESDNTAVATVDAAGKVTAVAKGSCDVFIYAQNGVCAKVKITVK